MREACSLIWSALVLLFRSRASLAAEILVLRHQINILRRHSPKRQTFSARDRLIFAGLYRLAPTVLNALAVLKPDTVIKWHRVGFRSYGRWRARRRGGRPALPTEIRKLIREMSIANPLWGAPRRRGNDAGSGSGNSKSGLDAGGRCSAATFSGRWKKRRRDRRAPEAEPRICLHAHEKARYQAETDGSEGEGEMTVSLLPSIFTIEIGGRPSLRWLTPLRPPSRSCRRPTARRCRSGWIRSPHGYR